MKIIQHLIFLITLVCIAPQKATALTTNQLALGATLTATLGSSLAAWTVYTEECQQAGKEPNLSDFKKLLESLVLNQNNATTIKAAYALHPKLTVLVLTTKGICGLTAARLLYNLIAPAQKAEPIPQPQPTPAPGPQPHPEPQPNPNPIIPPEDPAITKQRDDALKIIAIQKKLRTPKVLTPEEKKQRGLAKKKKKDNPEIPEDPTEITTEQKPEEILTPEELKIWQEANQQNPERTEQIQELLTAETAIQKTAAPKITTALTTAKTEVARLISDPTLDEKLRKEIIRDYKSTTESLEFKLKNQQEPEAAAAIADAMLGKLLQRTTDDLLRQTQEKFGCNKTREQMYALLDANKQIRPYGDLKTMIADQQALINAFEEYLVAEQATKDPKQKKVLEEQLTHNVEQITGATTFLEPVFNLFDQPLSQQMVDQAMKYNKNLQVTRFKREELPYRLQNVVDVKNYIICDRKVQGRKRCQNNSNINFQTWIHINCVECNYENDFCEKCFVEHEQARECYGCSRRFTANDLEKATIYHND